MFRGTFNARRGNQAIKKNLEAFQSRTAEVMLFNLKKFTPKRSGLAAKSWRKTKQTGFDYTLSNTQPYVPRLDRGYSSQAPRGFYQPASRQTRRTNKGRFSK